MTIGEVLVTLGIVLAAVFMIVVIGKMRGDDGWADEWPSVWTGFDVQPDGDLTLVRDYAWLPAADVQPTAAYAALAVLAPPTEELPTVAPTPVEVQRLDGDEFFRADPLGSASLPDELELADFATDVFVELMDAGALTPQPAVPVTGVWVPWGYELEVAAPVEPTATFELCDDVALTAELQLVGAGV